MGKFYQTFDILVCSMFPCSQYQVTRLHWVVARSWCTNISSLDGLVSVLDCVQGSSIKNVLMSLLLLVAPPYFGNPVLSDSTSNTSRRTVVHPFRSRTRLEAMGPSPWSPNSDMSDSERLRKRGHRCYWFLLPIQIQIQTKGATIPDCMVHVYTRVGYCGAMSGGSKMENGGVVGGLKAKRPNNQRRFSRNFDRTFLQLVMLCVRLIRSGASLQRLGNRQGLQNFCSPFLVNIQRSIIKGGSNV